MDRDILHARGCRQGQPLAPLARLAPCKPKITDTRPGANLSAKPLAENESIVILKSLFLLEVIHVRRLIPR
jgi:hypothetical protein